MESNLSFGRTVTFAIIIAIFALITAVAGIASIGLGIVMWLILVIAAFLVGALGGIFGIIIAVILVIILTLFGGLAVLSGYAIGWYVATAIAAAIFLAPAYDSTWTWLGMSAVWPLPIATRIVLGRATLEKKTPIATQ
jgi:hypothetical protein